MNEQIEAVWSDIVQIVATYGVDVLGAVVILVVGWLAAGWLSAAAGKALSRTSRIDEMLRGFVTGAIKYAVLTFTALAVLSQFGVETTSIIAVLGAAGLAIGLALQGTLTNLAAGVMLLIFRPFRVGQFIEVGSISGTVDRLSLFTTEMHTPDNVHIIVPNNQLWNTPIKNFSHNPTRRVDLDIGIAYEDDIDKAFAIVRDCIGADTRIAADPEPFIVVGELADSSVNLIIRVWCAAPDYWAVRFALIKAVKESFDRGGVTIPFPQRTLHIENSASVRAAE